MIALAWLHANKYMLCFIAVLFLYAYACKKKGFITKHKKEEKRGLIDFYYVPPQYLSLIHI